MKKHIGLTFLTCCILFNCNITSASNVSDPGQAPQNGGQNEQQPLDYVGISERAERLAAEAKQAGAELQLLLNSVDVKEYSFEYGEGKKEKNFYLYMPKVSSEEENKKVPCLVFMHGGNASYPLEIDHPRTSIENSIWSDEKDDKITWTLLPMIAALVNKGIAVATITFAPLNKDSLPIWEQIENQVNIITGNSNIDKKRMFFIGHSFGGYTLSQMLVSPKGARILQDNFKLGVGFEAPGGITKTWGGGAWAYNDNLEKLCYFGNNCMKQLLSFGIWDAGRYLMYYEHILNKCEEIGQRYTKSNDKNNSELLLMINRLKRYYVNIIDKGVDSGLVTLKAENETEKQHYRLLSNVFNKIVKQEEQLQRKENGATVEKFLLQKIKNIIQKEKEYTRNMLTIRDKIQFPFEQKIQLPLEQDDSNKDLIELTSRSSEKKAETQMASSFSQPIPEFNSDFENKDLETLYKLYIDWIREALKWQKSYYNWITQLQASAVRNIELPIYIFGATGDFNSTKRQYTTLHKTLSNWLPKGTCFLKPIKEYPYSLHWIHRIRDKYVSGHEDRDNLANSKGLDISLAKSTLNIRKHNFNKFIDDIESIFNPSRPENSPKQTGQKKVNKKVEKELSELIGEVEKRENEGVDDQNRAICRSAVKQFERLYPQEGE